MNFYNHSYYRLSINVNRLIGQWPYQRRWESSIHCFIIVFFLISQNISQISGLIYYKDNMEIVLELVIPSVTIIAMAIKYLNIIFNVKTMIKLLKYLEENWIIYTKKNEKHILNDYARTGQYVIYVYAFLVYITVIILIIEPLVPKWLNYILQLNATIPYKYPIPIHWYNVDMEKNFYPILCYESICILAIMTITVANDSMLIIFLQHCCALFAIVGHQLKNLPHENKKDWDHNKDIGNVDKIQLNHYIMCIKNHKRAIEFARLLEKMYVWCFGGIILLHLPGFSVTAVQIFTQKNTFAKYIKYSFTICSYMMHLFFICYLSQRLIDCSAAIQQYIIYSNWYGMSLKTKKLVGLVTLRSQVPCKMTAGKLTLLSMETFSMIVRTSISCFTLIRTMRRS